MQHVGGLAGVHCPLAVRAHLHAFGLDADVDLPEHLGGLRVDHRDQRIVFVGDIQPAVVGVQGELLGVGARGQLLDDLAAGEVDHLHGVRIAGADVQQLVVVGQRQPARALAGVDGAGDGQGIQIDDAEIVVLLVGHVGGGGEGRGYQAEREAQAGEGKQAGHGQGPHGDSCYGLAFHGWPSARWHWLSGASRPRLSSSLAGCRKPSCGEVLTRARGCTSGIGWRSWPSQGR